MTLEFPTPNLSQQRIIERRAGQIELLPDRMVYRLDIVTEEPKDTTLDEQFWEWEEDRSWIHNVVKKEAILGVELCRGGESWKLYIMLANCINITIHSHKKGELMELRDKLEAYIFNS